MCCKIGDTPNRIALYFDIRRIHLFDEGVETSQCDDGNLVFRWKKSVEFPRLPHCSHTIDCQVAECRAGSPLYLDIWILQKEQDRFKGISVDFSHI